MAIYSHGRENLGIKALRRVRGWYFPGMVSCLGWQTQLATCPSHWGKVTLSSLNPLSLALKGPVALSCGVHCSPGGLAVKTPPAGQEMQETWVPSLSWKDPAGEGNGNPLQCSCPGNAVDRGAWWTTVHGVAESQAGLSD